MERRLVQTELNMIRAFESMDRDHQGYDTSRGAAHRRPVAVVPARAQDDRLLLGGAAGLAGALGEARRGDRGGQSRATSPPTRWTRKACARAAPPRRLLQGDAGLRRRAEQPAGQRHRHDAPAAVDGVRAGRGHVQARLAHRVGAARRGNRRLPDRADQQSHQRVPAHRRGQSLPLPADLHAQQHRLRRQVPDDRGERPPAGNAGVRAQGLPGGPLRAARGRRLRRAGAGDARPRRRCRVHFRSRPRPSAFPIPPAPA